MSVLSVKQQNSRLDQMVTQSIVSRGIVNQRVVQAMKKVDRQLFVPESLRQHAYADRALPIGHEQTISQPYIVAVMTDTLIAKGVRKVLEIGTGSGYQAAILAELGCVVFSVERVGHLAREARRRLELLRYDHVSVCVGNGALGWGEFAPFEGIIVTAAMDDIPKALEEQLAVGGVLVGPMVVADDRQELWVYEKTKTGLVRRTLLCACRFVPFIT